MENFRPCFRSLKLFFFGYSSIYLKKNINAKIIQLLVESFVSVLFSFADKLEMRYEIFITQENLLELFV